MDSTICRAHQHAAGARRDGRGQVGPPGGAGGAEPPDHGLGRSRGGMTTKLHLACEQPTRYDKLAVRYKATIQVAIINIWLRALANTTS